MQEVQEVIKSAGDAGIAKMRRCCWCCYAITKKAAFLRPLIIQTLHQATCWLPMLPVRLRHAADHLSEHQYPIHLVFLDRVPGCIALVI